MQIHFIWVLVHAHHMEKQPRGPGECISSVFLRFIKKAHWSHWNASSLIFPIPYQDASYITCHKLYHVNHRVSLYIGCLSANYEGENWYFPVSEIAQSQHVFKITSELFQSNCGEIWWDFMTHLFISQRIIITSDHYEAHESDGSSKEEAGWHVWTAA